MIVQPPASNALVGIGGTSATGGRTPVLNVNILSYLTASDRGLIQASTGDAINADGVVTNPGTKAVSPMILQIANERMSGTLTGDITPAYLDSMFANAQKAGAALPADDLARALQFLETKSNSLDVRA